MRIFLDMDGTLVNFVKGAARLFDQDYETLLGRWTPGIYDMESVLGLTKGQFFAALDKAGEDFWANLLPYPYARDFYDHCVDIAPTYILSSPTYDASSLSGKIRWLHNMFGREFRNYILTSKKEMCARDCHILIDDHIINVERFREHGGKAILWPTPFNSRHEEAHVALDVVMAELEETCRQIINHGCS